MTTKKYCNTSQIIYRGYRQLNAFSTSPIHHLQFVCIICRAYQNSERDYFYLKSVKIRKGPKMTNKWRAKRESRRVAEFDS